MRHSARISVQRVRTRLHELPWRQRAQAQARSVRHLVKWITLGVISGLLAGGGVYVFLEGLDWVTERRLANPWLVWLLPVAGLAVGVVYTRVGGRSARGNDLLIDLVHTNQEWAPRRMAPLVLVGTWTTHLFGGSAGREGTAMQMSGSLSSLFGRLIRLSAEDRRTLLVAALGAGFSAVFQAPLAGTVFAMEVQSVGRMRYDALVPTLTASLVSNLALNGLGFAETTQRQLQIPLDASIIWRVALAGVAFGLGGAAFGWLTHAVERLTKRLAVWPPLRQVMGGCAVVAGVLVFGREYLGLSLGWQEQALAGVGMGFGVFLLKLVFTSVTLGSGFPGGEVTPMFVMGSTLGAALAGPLGLPVATCAAVGYVALFAGAANTPLACTILGAEVFGAGAVLPIAIGCVVAYVFSGHRGIYTTQRIVVTKQGRIVDAAPSAPPRT